MTGKTVAALLLVTLLSGSVWAAGNAKKAAAPQQRSSKTFAVRGESAKTAEQTALARSEDEPIREEENWIDYSIPVQLGAGPTAPTACRHDDLSRDLEFRLCMQQVLGTFGSLRMSQEAAGE